MKNGRGTVIYVGKAKQLKTRVMSYFNHSRKDIKTRKLVEHIYDLDVMITKTESEALLLERTLIKHHKPQFNILLRDDKEYPYIRVDFGEDWPRIEKVRRRKEDNATYLGPFGNAGQLKVLLDMTYRIFPLIRCSRHEFATTRRPCNYYDMKMCLAPCKLPVDRTVYMDMMENTLDFLRGKNKRLLQSLREKMQKASENEQYEYAALLRDQLKAYEIVTQKQSVVPVDIDDADIIGFAESEFRCGFHILIIRDGKLVGNDSFVLHSPVQEAQESLMDFVLQYYESRSLPKEILTSLDLEDTQSLKLVLLETHPEASQLIIKSPSRGSRMQLTELACKNAVWQLDESQRREDRQRIELSILKEKLKLPKFPTRIECIDISNMQGTAIVASNVCFIAAKPAKEFYRHYRIEDHAEKPDDYESIRIVVRRRLDRAVRDDDLPDLLIIDGGRGQLNAALDVLKDFPHLDLQIVGLAKSRSKSQKGRNFIDTGAPSKSFERVFFPNLDQPLALAPGTPEFRILTQIRDEAHRFAITHHRKRRSKISHASELEDIPGIGPKLRQKLLETFGSIEKIAQAELYQLLEVKGLGEAAAVRLHAHFRDK